MGTRRSARGGDVGQPRQHPLPAAALASVCGYSQGTGSGAGDDRSATESPTTRHYQLRRRKRSGRLKHGVTAPPRIAAVYREDAPFSWELRGR